MAFATLHSRDDKFISFIDFNTGIRTFLDEKYEPDPHEESYVHYDGHHHHHYHQPRQNVPVPEPGSLIHSELHPNYQGHPQHYHHHQYQLQRHSERFID